MDIKIALAQINATPGDLTGNSRKIMESIAAAEREAAHILLFPEMALPGYPLKDLVFDKDFSAHCQKSLLKIAESSGECLCLVGTLHEEAGNFYNAIALLQQGKIQKIIYKSALCAGAPYHETRYFAAASALCPVEVTFRGSSARLAIQIADILQDKDQSFKTSELLAKQGADIILNPCASAFFGTAFQERLSLAKEIVQSSGLPFVSVNLVGSQDELIFDGHSFALDKEASLSAEAAAFREDLVFCSFQRGPSKERIAEQVPDEDADLRAALRLGIRDYFEKSGFRDAIIGMSGGIDSALVAVLAVEALGAEHVYGYAMPSKFSNRDSLEDAKACSRNLGMHYEILPITDIYEHYLQILKKPFEGTSFGLAEENLQARIRGNILMAIANKKNALLLSTGNRTELALGYCTLYGDMCGALAPINDLSKTEVYRLARYLNSCYGYPVIPENSIEKVPSAELAENQFDPFDYDITDPLVEDMLYKQSDIETLIRKSGDPDLVLRLYNLIRNNEYKRRQAAPGLKRSEKAIRPGREMPLLHRFTIK